MMLTLGWCVQLPHVFKSSAEFDSWFNSWNACGADTAEEGTAAAHAAKAALREEQLLIVTNRLHQVLRPFVLRRTKDILSTALPPKIERAIKCPMSTYQQKMLSLLANKGCEGGKHFKVKGVNNMLMEMRKVRLAHFVFTELKGKCKVEACKRKNGTPYSTPQSSNGTAAPFVVLCKKSIVILGVKRKVFGLQICNDPLTSMLHVPGSDSSLHNHCLPSSMQLGGKMAVLIQLLHRLEFLGMFHILQHLFEEGSS